MRNLFLLSLMLFSVSLVGDTPKRVVGVSEGIVGGGLENGRNYTKHLPIYDHCEDSRLSCRFATFLEARARASMPFLFEPPETPSTFLFSGWSFYYKITVDPTQAGSADTSNFTVLVNITGDTNMKTSANGGLIQNTVTFNGQTVPADVGVFTDTGCTTQVIAWDEVSYSGSAGNLEIWFGPVTLSHTSTASNTYYLCFDNSSQSTYAGGSVGAAYDTGYKIIQHWPDGTTINNNDASASGNNGSPNGGQSAVSGNGQMDGASQFTGTVNSCVKYTTVSIATNVTMEAWAKSSTMTSANMGFWSKLNVNTQWEIFVQGGTLFLRGGDTSHDVTATAPSNSAWHHLVGVIAGTTGTLYVDGSQVATGTATAIGNGSGLVVAGALDQSGTYMLAGIQDESRIYAGAYTASRVTAHWNMQKSGQTMVTLGAKTAVGGVTRSFGPLIAF